MSSTPFSKMAARVCIFAVIFICSGSIVAEPLVAWRTNSPASAFVEVVGLESDVLSSLASGQRSLAEWQKILPVYAESGHDPLAVIDLPPMAGQYSVADNRLVFKPQFPLQPGVDYVAVFRTRAVEGTTSDRDAVSASIKLPTRVLVPAAVVHNIYPTAEELPENLLKFYVQFSESMSGGAIYEHIELADDKGNAVELPFLEIDEELWNPEMTRLTLFIDPGRIKRGVKPLEDIGPALEAGRSFTLKISDHWLDAKGAPLKKRFAKRFTVTEPDRTSPDHRNWKFTPPSAGTKTSLVVRFGESLDYALTLRLLQVVTADGKVVQGRAELGDREQIWVFTPETPWAGGNYQLRCENILEDLAGNSIGKVFEVDLFEGVQHRLVRSSVSLPFTVR